MCVRVCVCVCACAHTAGHMAAHSLVEEAGKKKPFSDAGKGHNLDEDCAERWPPQGEGERRHQAVTCFHRVRAGRCPLLP